MLPIRTLSVILNGVKNLSRQGNMLLHQLATKLRVNPGDLVSRFAAAEK